MATHLNTIALCHEDREGGGLKGVLNVNFVLGGKSINKNNYGKLFHKYIEYK